MHGPCQHPAVGDAGDNSQLYEAPTLVCGCGWEDGGVRWLVCVVHGGQVVVVLVWEGVWGCTMLCVRLRSCAAIQLL